MTPTMRSYNASTDFSLIGSFLLEHYQTDNQDGNWLQPAWEYMHSHPLLDESSLTRIGVWEDEGQIVAVVHYEWALGEAFLQVDPAYAHLKTEMLDYAEDRLYGADDQGRRYLRVYANDFDLSLLRLLQQRGYARQADFDRPMTRFAIPNPFPGIALPDGFRLKTLEEDNDLRKVHRVLWRGFDHPGEPDEEGIKDRKKMQSVPGYRTDLNIVVQAPDGFFVAYSGAWYDPLNRLAYVEPVATDPDYRRLGLGRAAVLEGVRRCGELGATVAYVGSNLPFYKAIGFEDLYVSQCWTRFFPAHEGQMGEV
jgi:GNAT superfamily N-acetyltransferase